MQERSIMKSKQELIRECLQTSNEYIKKLNLSFEWKDYDNCIKNGPKGKEYKYFFEKKGGKFGYYYFGGGYYAGGYGKFFKKQEEEIMKKEGFKFFEWMKFDDGLFQIAEEFFEYLEKTRGIINKMK